METNQVQFKVALIGRSVVEEQQSVLRRKRLAVLECLPLHAGHMRELCMRRWDMRQARPCGRGEGLRKEE